MQNGAAGVWDPQAYEFLKQSHSMLAADGINPMDYMFQATAEQKVEADMYANYLPQTAAFTITSGNLITAFPGNP